MSVIKQKKSWISPSIRTNFPTRRSSTEALAVDTRLQPLDQRPVDYQPEFLSPHASLRRMAANRS